MSAFRISLCLLGLSACAAPFPSEADCSDATAGVTGSMIAGVSTGDGLVLSGTAVQPAGLALRAITIAGVDAVPREGTLNFAQWDATVPSSVLAALSPVEGRVTLEAKATDACGRTKTLATLDVAAPTPNRIDGLSLDLAYPGDEMFLPATLAIPAMVKVRATGRAVGVEVSLSAPGARFVGGDEEGGTTVTLRADGDAATGIVWFTSATPGRTAIVATALGAVARATLEVSGAPRFFPAEAEVAAGREHRVEVYSEGRLAKCEALPPEGVSVTYRDENVVGAVTLESADARLATFHVSSDSDLADEASVVILCRDAFGQSASARIRFVP